MYYDTRGIFLLDHFVKNYYFKHIMSQSTKNISKAIKISKRNLVTKVYFFTAIAINCLVNIIKAEQEKERNTTVLRGSADWTFD